MTDKSSTINLPHAHPTPLSTANALAAPDSTTGNWGRSAGHATGSYPACQQPPSCPSRQSACRCDWPAGSTARYQHAGGRLKVDLPPRKRGTRGGLRVSSARAKSWRWQRAVRRDEANPVRRPVCVVTSACLIRVRATPSSACSLSLAQLASRQADRQPRAEPTASVAHSTKHSPSPSSELDCTQWIRAPRQAVGMKRRSEICGVEMRIRYS
jgi:hypothetical protein